MDRSSNILKWYPFKENSKILEIYNQYSIIEKLNMNVKLEKCDIKDFKIEGKYDYITLIGTYEYATSICKGEKPYSTFLKILKEHLNKDGKVLLAIDNRLGMKYFAGAKNEHYETIFEGIESEIRNEKPNLLVKGELEKFIKEAGFENFKFYYPLPDYKNTNSIYTDEFLPKSNHSKIVYPVEYEADSHITFNEINVIKQICDINKFESFTNSYFIEISNQVIENDIRFVNYNIFRKDDYRLVLIMKNESVEKFPMTEKAIKHINNIDEHIKKLQELGFNVAEKVEEGKIVSKFIKSEELDKKIIDEIKKGNIDSAYLEIERWYSYIKERLEKNNTITNQNVFQKYEITIPNEIKEKMNFVTDGYIDLSFENVFCDENNYIFYDQEWYIKNIPLEFILYRSINNLYAYNKSKIERKIKQSEMFEKFNLNEYIEYFKQLEEKIQLEILDENIVSDYRKKIRGYFVDIDQLYKSNEEKEIKLIEIQSKYEKLEKDKNELYDKYCKLINERNNSFGWKMKRGIKRLIGKE